MLVNAAEKLLVIYIYTMGTKKTLLLKKLVVEFLLEGNLFFVSQNTFVGHLIMKS